MKSLIRFKLVSKHWHSLITNPQFCLLCNPNPNPAFGIFALHYNGGVNSWYEYVPLSVNETSTNPPFRQLKFAGENLNILIVQSCNGLLLCCSSGGRDRCRTYYVYNPTTNKFSTLPEVDNISSSISTLMHGISLYFDPTRSPHYKVVCVLGLGLSFWDYRYQIEVYSSETGLWRKWGDLFAAQVHFNGVYWNGAIHWIGCRTSDSLYFNPDDNDHQTPQIMPMPPSPHDRDCRESFYFGESCDHLHYVEFFEMQFPEFNVYEMKRDYSEWFVKYQVDLSHGDPERYYCEFSIFEVVRGEKEEDAFLVFHIWGGSHTIQSCWQDF